MTSERDLDVRGDVRTQIREFLTSRGLITPQQAGLPVFDTARRRVPGLRREETAMLAGISSEYYVRLERGDATGISEGVVDGLVHALQLDEAERSHLLDLLRVAGSARRSRRRPPVALVRPTVQRIIDSMVGTPAFVINGRDARFPRSPGQLDNQRSPPRAEEDRRPRLTTMGLFEP